MHRRAIEGSATQLLDGEKTVRDAITQISTNITKLSKGGKTLTASNKKLRSGAAAIVKEFINDRRTARN